MSGGLTLDTAALIALERGDRRMAALLRVAVAKGLTVTVPTVVVAEWWRGQRGPAARLLDTMTVEALDRRMAERVGEALKLVEGKGPSLVDVTVVATAAARGDCVVTSDFDDLTRVRDSVFRSVRISGW